MSASKPLPETQALAEQIGELVYCWGFKRIHGKIWTHLFLAQKPLDAADLVRRLEISKALVSISLRELCDYDLVRFAGRSDRGTQLYTINAEVWSVVTSVLRQREKQMLSRIQVAHENLSRVPRSEREQSGLNGKNFDSLLAMIQKATSSLDGLIALKSIDIGEMASAFSLESSLDTRDSEVQRAGTFLPRPSP